MSEIQWRCYRARFPFGGPALVAECLAPDVQAAIRTFADALRRPAAEFSVSPRAWQTARTTYFVQSAASAALSTPKEPKR